MKSGLFLAAKGHKCVRQVTNSPLESVDGKLREMNLGILSRFKRTKVKAGQSMVKFAMVVPLFFLLIFGIIDIGRVFYVEMTLQNAVRQAGRYAVTGQNTVNGVQTNRVTAIEEIAQQQAEGLVANLQNIEVYTINGDGTTNMNNGGGPTAVVHVAITYNMQIITPLIAQFFPNGTYNFTVSTVFQNEPFPPSNSN